MRLEKKGATATVLGDITAAIIGSITITTTIMGMGLTGLTTDPVTGLVTIMVVTAMPIPTGAAPA